MRSPTNATVHVSNCHVHVVGGMSGRHVDSPTRLFMHVSADGSETARLGTSRHVAYEETARLRTSPWSGSDDGKVNPNGQLASISHRVND